jgi:hypothetical protein
MRTGELTDSQIHAIIERAAMSHRTDQVKPFYPLRDMARQLEVPVSAVVRVYGRLKKQGILASLRGSRTHLLGRRSGRRLHIKSFIGLPVSYSSFLTLQDYRRFYLELRNEAQLRGFVCNLIFYTDSPGGLEELRKTVYQFGVDSLIWFRPRVSVRDTVLRLRDKGIPILGVSDSDPPGMPCRYEIHREKALRAILRRWRTHAGIDSILITRADQRSVTHEEVIENAADTAGVAWEYVSIREGGIERSVMAMQERSAKGLILPAGPASLLSLRAPEALSRLLESCYVAFPDGPITTVSRLISDVPVDLITVDWRTIAKKIVADLVRKSAFQENRSITFGATPRYRVLLRRYAEII